MNAQLEAFKQFKEFISATGYETDAERYGWSIVQLNVYDYKIVDGATWLRPDGDNLSIDSLPVTYILFFRLKSTLNIRIICVSRINSRSKCSD